MAKDATIQLRLKSEEKEIMKRAAELDQRNVSSFVTLAALKAAKQIIAEHAVYQRLNGDLSSFVKLENGKSQRL